MHIGARFRYDVASLCSKRSAVRPGSSTSPSGEYILEEKDFAGLYRMLEIMHADYKIQIAIEKCTKTRDPVLFIFEPRVFFLMQFSPHKNFKTRIK